MKPTKEDWKGLWALFWRVALFGTLLLPLGAVVFLLVMAFLILPPTYAVIVIATGDVLLGLGVGALWFWLFRWARPLLARLSEGSEYAGI